MKRSLLVLTLLGFMLSSYSQDRTVSSDLEINSSTAKVWDVITNPMYARILGAEFDKGAFVESEWTLGSDVHFKYEPDRLISTGTISKLVVQEVIQVDYDFDGFKYNEKYALKKIGDGTVLHVIAGPYLSDYEAQIVVWSNWLAKVKELSESE